MSKDNLPAKSRSRGIQPVHTRNVMTKAGRRDVVVNPGVKKKSSSKSDSRTLVRKDRSSIVKKDSKSMVSKDRSSSSPSPKLRWQDVMKKDSGELARKELSEKEREEIKERLRPGERYAQSIKAVEIGPGFDGRSSRLNIIIVNEKGEDETISAKLESGSPVTVKFIDYIKSLKGKNKKIIFKEPESKNKGSEGDLVEAMLGAISGKPEKPAFDFEVARGANGEIMGMMSGSKDLEYVRDYETGVKFNKAAPMRQYGISNNADGSATMILVDKDGNPTRFHKTYSSPQAAQKAWAESASKTTDPVGVRWDAQTDIGEFENLSGPEDLFDLIPEDIIFRTFLDNGRFREAVIFNYKGLYRVMMTDFTDMFDHSMTQDFGSLKQAKDYINAVGGVGN